MAQMMFAEDVGYVKLTLEEINELHMALQHWQQSLRNRIAEDTDDILKNLQFVHLFDNLQPNEKRCFSSREKYLETAAFLQANAEDKMHEIAVSQEIMRKLHLVQCGESDVPQVDVVVNADDVAKTVGEHIFNCQ